MACTHLTEGTQTSQSGREGPGVLPQSAEPAAWRSPRAPAHIVLRPLCPPKLWEAATLQKPRGPPPELEWSTGALELMLPVFP